MLCALKMCLPVSRRGASPIDARTRTKQERPSRTSPHCSQKPKVFEKPRAETIDVDGKHAFRPRQLNSFSVKAHVDASKARVPDDDVDDDDDGASQSSTAIGSGMSTSDGTLSPKSSDTRQSASFALVHLGDVPVVERDTQRLRLRRVDSQRLPKRGGLTQRELDRLSVVAPENVTKVVRHQRPQQSPTRTNWDTHSRQRA